MIDVMIVDDSAVVRQVLTDLLSSDPGINIMATASDPIFAMSKMEKKWPDVLVIDIEMPRMDGITFLRKIMSEHPTPVIVCSSLTDKGAEATMQALSAGAIDIVAKPKIGLKNFLSEQQYHFINVVKSANKVNLTKLSKSLNKEIPNKPNKAKATKATKTDKSNTLGIDDLVPNKNITISTTTEQVIAIGTSTGGTQALERVLVNLPRVTPGIVIVQHMPEKFTNAFANRLNNICEMDVIEASDGDRVIPGRVLIAPGGKHMQLKRSGAKYFVEVADGPLVNRHKPSVDVLFRSVANIAGKNTLGIIMTGMGADGAIGITDMNKAGAFTIAQDEKTSVVFGMPKEAIKLGGIDKVVGIDQITEEILSYSNKVL